MSIPNTSESTETLQPSNEEQGRQGQVTAAFLRSERVTKYFGSMCAVRAVSLEFAPGEIHALIGENGSGKSTFCSMLTGIYPISEGKFFLEGKELHVHNQVEANQAGVAIIVQEIGTLPGLTVAENIFLGSEKPFMHGPLRNIGAMNAKAQSLLDAYGFGHIKAGKMIDLYSFEDRKLVEMVKATYFKPKVLVVDETTTALSHDGREHLFAVMDKMRGMGHTVIFISHDLEEVIEHTDRISCLRDGDLVGTVNTKDVTPDDLKTMMVGHELGGKYYRTDYGTPIAKEVVLSMNDVTVPGQIEHISLELHRGEILGIGGLSECGMHEVGKAIFGASYDMTGSVALGNGHQIKSINDAIKHGIAYASKDRDNESIVIADSIAENIALPSLDELAKNRVVRQGVVIPFADKAAKQMKVKMSRITQFVSDLSGGNKQKVVLARWIGKGSDILVLDSPTRGIDIMVKANIYALMEEFKKQGKSVLMISEEMPELLGMSDRILVMKDGKINGEFARSKTLSDRDIIACMI